MPGVDDGGTVAFNAQCLEGVITDPCTGGIIQYPEFGFIGPFSISTDAAYVWQNVSVPCFSTSS
jgi:hypothetical protein